jgi:NADP-dependent aldehyde dehydrogenase
MSAINPLIILPQALDAAEALANELVASFTLGGGQFCTRPGLILALRGAGLERFKSALCAAVAGSRRRCCSMRRPFSTTARAWRRWRRTRVSRSWRAASPRARAGADPAVAGSGRGSAGAGYAAADRSFRPAIAAGGSGRRGPAAGGGESAAGQLTATLHAEADDGPLAAACYRCCAKGRTGAV